MVRHIKKKRHQLCKKGRLFEEGKELMSIFLSRQFHDPNLRNHTVEFFVFNFFLACSMPGPLLDADNTKMT